MQFFDSFALLLSKTFILVGETFSIVQEELIQFPWPRSLIVFISFNEWRHKIVIEFGKSKSVLATYQIQKEEKPCEKKIIMIQGGLSWQPFGDRSEHLQIFGTKMVYLYFCSKSIVFTNFCKKNTLFLLFFHEHFWRKHGSSVPRTCKRTAFLLQKNANTARLSRKFTITT